MSTESTDANAFFARYHAVKSDYDIEGWTDFFDPSTVYGDATVGWFYPDRASFRAILEQFVPNWAPGGRAYATRVFGDTGSAVVAVTDTPELFGSEIRILAAVDVVDGRIVRFVDYWDGRHFGAGLAAQLRTPADQFPVSFGEDSVAGTASTRMRQVAEEVNRALAEGDPVAIGDLFSEDAVFEDLTLHLQFVGRKAIAGYFDRARRELPYSRDARVVHVLGSDDAGGYEWRAPGEAVPRGIVALELGPDGITRFAAVWDGGLLNDEQMLAMLRSTIEA